MNFIQNKDSLRGIAIESSSYDFNPIYMKEIITKIDLATITSINATTWTCLKDLYISTRGNEWKNNTHWLTNKPFNQWFGIYTASDGFTVSQIYLPNNNLQGSLPYCICNFTSLYSLQLQSNLLKG